MIAKQPLIQTLLLFTVLVAVMGALQAVPSFPDPDSFYHAKMAVLMHDKGIVVRALPSASATLLADRFADQHFLYHVALIPFVTFFDVPADEAGPLIGIKIFTALAAALTLTVFWLILRRLRVPHPWLFLFLALTTEPFLFRMNLGKASALVVLWILLTILATIERRPRILFALSFIWVWLHGSFLLAPIIAGLAALIHRFVPEHSRGAADMRLFGASLLGVILGNIINPFFPTNLIFAWEQSIYIPLTLPFMTNAGNEWYPYTLGAFALAMPILLLVLLGTLTVFIQRPRTYEQWLLALLTLFFLFLTIKSKRVIEYLALPALLWAGIMLRDAWDERHRIMEFFRVWHARALRTNTVLIALLILALFGMIVRDADTLIRSTRNGIPMTRYREAMHWLRDNTPADSVVFHTGWDEWPMFFYWNTHNRFLVGLDPRFLSRKDPLLFRAWMDASAGKTPDALPTVIRDQFHADYVIATSEHAKFREQLEQHPAAFKKMYEDAEATIFSTSSSPSPQGEGNTASLSFEERVGVR